MVILRITNITHSWVI